MYCIYLLNGHKTKTFEDCHQHHDHDHEGIIIIIVNIDLPRGFGHLLGKHFFSPMSAAGTM